MEIDFSGQVAVVTGAASGIGKAVCEKLGKSGATIVMLDFNASLLERTAAKLKSEGVPTDSYLVDISKEDEVSETISQINSQYGKIDILVNSAGIVGPTSTNITEYSTEDFQKVYNINLLGSFLICKHTLPVMKQKGFGKILLVASMAGKEGNPGMIGYSTTKAGVIGMVKALGKEYAQAGISINGLAPAVIKTEMNADTSEEQLKYMKSKIPMGRIGTVEEVAEMIAFIVSKENSFSTGFIYDISGGRATY